MRAVELAKTGKHFRFVWRLAPVNGTRCNSKVITLASFRPGDKRVRGAVRTRPSHSFSYAQGRDLRSRAWHAFAVEVTPTHIGIDEYDVATQRLVSHHTHIRDGVADVSSGRFRYVWPAELDLMARIAGMSVVDRWSGWDRGKFTSDSTSHVSVWRRPL